MEGLVELIFERVPDAAVDRLVRDLLQGADILDLSHSELGSLDPGKAGQGLIPLLMMEVAPASIFLRSACATIGGVPIHRPLVRILRFEGSNEVVVVFNNGDVDADDRNDAVTKLAVGAKVLATDADASDYYCGFEPATDEKTRLFSKDRLGPLVAI